MTEPSDAELLVRFRQGESVALESLFQRYETPVYSFLLGVLRDPHNAADALQETFIRALERLDTVDGDHLRGWLFTVAYHQAMLQRRKNSARLRCVRSMTEEADTVDDFPGPAACLESREDAERLRELLQQLPESQREVIRQRVYEGRKFKDIAEQLGCPLNTALARMHEGLKRLRVLWGDCHA